MRGGCGKWTGWAGVMVAALLLSGCGGVPQRPVSPMPAPKGPVARHPSLDTRLPALPAAGSGRGGYYKDDGPEDNPPPGLWEVPDAVFKAEPYSRFANRRYSVFGKTYQPMLPDAPFSQRGVASWYGKKFHGQRTSSGELYDMYKMTAAHPTLPIPSYARITSVDSGKSVVVRINDRGPFHSSRIVDVSYTAALKLGLLGKGSHVVELERLLPADPARIATARRNAPAPEPLPDAASAAIAALMLEDRVIGENPAPAAAPTQQVVLPAQAGFYLQLGSFNRMEKAGQVRDVLMQSGAAAGGVEIVPAGALHRLYLGPFASRGLALQAAQTLPPALGLKPLLVRRGDATPANP